MSGAHSSFRTPSRPLFDDDGCGVPAVDNRGLVRFKLSPGYDMESGRHMSGYAIMQRHVLDFRPPIVRVSKHAAGRMKPLTKEQRRKAAKLDRDMRVLMHRIRRDEKSLAQALAHA